MGHSIWMPRLLTLIPLLPPNPSLSHRFVVDRCLLSDSTATPRGTHHLMREDTTPPGMMGLHTWAPPDHTLRGGMKAVAPDAMMTHPSLTGLTTRVLAGSMAVGHLITTCQRGLMDPDATSLMVH